jgi:hypothetical protein
MDEPTKTQVQCHPEAVTIEKLCTCYCGINCDLYDDLLHFGMKSCLNLKDMLLRTSLARLYIVPVPLISRASP